PALWRATAGRAEASRAASSVAGRALGRIGRDFTIGLARIASASPPRDEDYRAAANLLAVSLEKETAAVRSVVALAPAPEGTLRARGAALEQPPRERQALLVSTFQERSGGRAPVDSPGAAEQRLAGRVPKRAVATLAEWLALQEKVRDKRTGEDRAKREARD